QRPCERVYSRLIRSSTTAMDVPRRCVPGARPGHGALFCRQAPAGKEFVMRCNTIRSIGLGILMLGVALYQSAPCWAQNLQPIDKTTITIFDAYESYPGYDIANCLDTTSKGTTIQFVT